MHYYSYNSDYDEVVCSLFPNYNCSRDIEDLFLTAIEFAERECSFYVTMEHIICGLMDIIHGYQYKIPWYIPVEVYEEKHRMIKVIEVSNRKFRFMQDVYLFSDYYQNYFQNFPDILNINTIYYLIVFLQKNNRFEFNYYLPSENNLVEEIEPFARFFGSNYVDVDFNTATSALDLFSEPLCVPCSTDITYNAKENNYPKIIGREYELNRLIDILSKMVKNNAVLIGEPGVGKTAIVKALAQKIVDNTVPTPLKNHHILELDLQAAIAGCKYRGDFEQKIKDIFDELEDSTEKIILYIDEIHSAVNLGGAEGALTLSDMLKPFLLNSDIRVIGSSTFKEYRKLESDKALKRRFETITVKEPSFDQTLKILEHVRLGFEDHYGVEIPTSTLKSVISMSRQYIPEQFLPDKAIDLLDETCSIKTNSLINSPSKIKILPKDVLVCISRMKDIPVDKVQSSYNLDSLEEHLGSKIIGQTHVIDILSETIRRVQAGLNDENKPFASFMFIGPTGVGKTEVAKNLADIMFFGKDTMIRFDMSEYMEEHSVAKLIGAPPGYVGYEEAGLLTEQVRRHPYSLVLFDEFEKAHPKVCNLLLQILDEGALTDSHGEKINFKNTVIILTSNAGVSEHSNKSVGFVENPNSKSHDILAAVKKEFSPEFLNRLDEIILFNQLSEDDIFKIAEICISTDIISKLDGKNIHINIEDAVIREIAKLGYSQEYGARELKRTITRKLKNPLADFILKHKDVHYISIKLIDSKFVISSEVTAITV